MKKHSGLTTEKPKIRVQYEVSEDKRNWMDSLQKRAGCATKKELMDQALATFDWMLSEIKSGARIMSIRDKNVSGKELVLSCFFDLK